MKSRYCCNREAFKHYYQQQSGGDLNYFRGRRIQRGYGLGSLFRSFGKSVLPLISKGAKSLGKRLLHTGAQVASDVLGGANVGDSLKIRGKEAAGDALDSFLKRKMPPQKSRKKKKKRRRDIFD